MITSEELLAEIESYLDRHKMAETTFGRKSVNDGKLISRLRRGGQIQLKTAEKVKDFIQQAVNQHTAA